MSLSYDSPGNKRQTLKKASIPRTAIEFLLHGIMENTPSVHVMTTAIINLHAKFNSKDAIQPFERLI